MSTEFEIRNLLPRFCQLPFHRNLLMQITECFLFSCAVAAFFIGTFAANARAQLRGHSTMFAQGIS